MYARGNITKLNSGVNQSLGFRLYACLFATPKNFCYARPAPPVLRNDSVGHEDYDDNRATPQEPVSPWRICEDDVACQRPWNRDPALHQKRVQFVGGE